MNVFFVFADGSLVTPPLGGSILPGVTRSALLQLARDAGHTVREEPYAIDQWEADAKSGRLTESFACGTAAVITPIGKVRGRAHEFTIAEGGAGPISKSLLAQLVDIQRGRSNDPYGWVHKVF